VDPTGRRDGDRRTRSASVSTGLIDRIDALTCAGDEGWINAEGRVTVGGRIQGNAVTLVFQTRTALPDRERRLQDGFEG
jgi:hypothetical protein